MSETCDHHICGCQAIRLKLAELVIARLMDAMEMTREMEGDEGCMEAWFAVADALDVYDDCLPEEG
jgi:hypothetical protein